MDEKLQDFLFKLDLDEETRKRAQINPLRVLDDKRPEVQPAATASAEPPVPPSRIPWNP